MNKDKPLVDQDILEFFKFVTRFDPTWYQRDLLLDQNQFVVARWSRQSGKSLALAVFCLHFALSTSGRRIAILLPELERAKCRQNTARARDFPLCRDHRATTN